MRLWTRVGLTSQICVTALRPSESRDPMLFTIPPNSNAGCKVKEKHVAHLRYLAVMLAVNMGNVMLCVNWKWCKTKRRGISKLCQITHFWHEFMSWYFMWNTRLCLPYLERFWLDSSLTWALKMAYMKYLKKKKLWPHHVPWTVMLDNAPDLKWSHGDTIQAGNSGW